MQKIAALCIGLFWAGQVQADATFGDWQRVDLPDGACVLHQRVISKSSGALIADLWLDAQADGTAIASLRVPVGVSLASGAAFRHPGRDVAVPMIWQSCGAETCLAQAVLRPVEVDRWRGGQSVLLAFRPLPDSRPLVIPVSLRGITRGLAEVQNCRS